MTSALGKTDTVQAMPRNCTRENWRAAILLREIYGWRRDIDAWMPYSGAEPSEFESPGDMVAVSVRGFVHPRRLAIISESGGAASVICVYLGLLPPSDGLPEGAALFCDRLADRESRDRLLLWPVPLTKLAAVARPLGIAAANKPFRDLQAWHLAEHENGLAEKLIETELPMLCPMPLLTFDNGGFSRMPLPMRVDGGQSIH